MKLTNEQRKVVVDKIYNNLLKEIKPLQEKELFDFTKKHKKEIETLQKSINLIKCYDKYCNHDAERCVRNKYNFKFETLIPSNLKSDIIDKLIFESISTTNIEEIITNITNSFKNEILK